MPGNLTVVDTTVGIHTARAACLWGVMPGADGKGLFGRCEDMPLCQTADPSAGLGEQARGDLTPGARRTQVHRGHRCIRR